MHKDRIWCVSKIETSEELAESLADYSWCCCCGFELGDFLWLNDATGGDGAQEYAVVRKPTFDDPNYRQVESITASWCTKEEILRYIDGVQGDTLSASSETGMVLKAKTTTEFLSALSGKVVRPQSRIVCPVIETPEQHESCSLCR